MLLGGRLLCDYMIICTQLLQRNVESFETFIQSLSMNYIMQSISFYYTFKCKLFYFDLCLEW